MSEDTQSQDQGQQDQLQDEPQDEPQDQLQDQLQNETQGQAHDDLAARVDLLHRALAAIVAELRARARGQASELDVAGKVNEANAVIIEVQDHDAGRMLARRFADAFAAALEQDGVAYDENTGAKPQAEAVLAQLSRAKAHDDQSIVRELARTLAEHDDDADEQPDEQADELADEPDDERADEQPDEQADELARAEPKPQDPKDAKLVAWLALRDQERHLAGQRATAEREANDLDRQRRERERRELQAIDEKRHEARRLSKSILGLARQRERGEHMSRVHFERLQLEGSLAPVDFDAATAQQVRTALGQG